MPDHTLSSACLYGSEAWVAQVLGRSAGWLKKNRPDLEAQGFPRIDPITRLTVKADVVAWVETRRVVPDNVVPLATRGRVNHDAL